MKVLLLIIVVAIFSTSDAYGFITKDKSKTIGKQKKGIKSAKKVILTGKSTAVPKRQTVSVVTVETTTTLPTTVIHDTLAPNVKSKVNKLQLLEKQHYNGNRQLLIKHLQRQIALKKKLHLEKQSLTQPSPQTENNLQSKKQQDTTKQQQDGSIKTAKYILKDNPVSQDVEKPNLRVQKSVPKSVQQRERTKPSMKSTVEQNSNQVNNQQQNTHVQHMSPQLKPESIQPKINSQQNFDQMTHIQNNEKTVQFSNQGQQGTQNFVSQNQRLEQHFQQQPQSQIAQDINHIDNSFKPQQGVLQNSYNQESLQLSHQNQNQGNQPQYAQQQQSQQQNFVSQNQNRAQQIQQYPQKSNVQDIHRVEQSFMPQQDMMQIQTKFQNRNNIQPQMQMQSMDMLQPLNTIQRQAAAYTRRENNQLQSISPQQHIQMQQMPQQQSSHIINQMQPVLNQVLPRQHMLMPLNSMSMDPFFQSNMRMPERIVYVNSAGNNNPIQPLATAAPPVITTPKQTTTKPTTRPTTTTPRTTSISEPVNAANKDPGSLQYQFFEKEMKKQDLEIVKLQLEIRALKRAETYGPREMEVERRMKAPTTKATTTMHPFLAFGQKKFPFDF